MKNIEKEIKYELTPKSYLKLLRLLNSFPKRRYPIINFYIDDEIRSLSRRKVGFRLRISRSKAYLTVKYPLPSGRTPKAGLHIKREIEAPISRQKATLLVRGVLPFSEIECGPTSFLWKRHPNTMGNLKILGKMKMVRTVVFWKGLRLEVDRCKFHGKRFYELEVETGNVVAAEKILRELLTGNKIAFTPSRISKLSRFLKTLKPG